MESYEKADRVEDLRALNCGEPFIYIKGAIRLAGRELKRDQTLLLIVPKEKWTIDDETFNDLINNSGFSIVENKEDFNIVYRLRKL
jgi:TusA-related sulfurtransferase